MMITLPAESTRSAMTWSSRVSTSLTGFTIVRKEVMLTVMYTMSANTYAAGAKKKRDVSCQPSILFLVLLSCSANAQQLTQTSPVKEHGTFVPFEQFRKEADEAHADHAMEQCLG